MVLEYASFEQSRSLAGPMLPFPAGSGISLAADAKPLSRSVHELAVCSKGSCVPPACLYTDIYTQWAIHHRSLTLKNLDRSLGFLKY